MPDLNIRNVTYETLASLDAHAQGAGMSREAWIRQKLDEIAERPVIKQFYKLRAYGPGNAFATIILHGKGNIGGDTDNLNDKQMHVYEQVWDLVERNESGNRERAIALLLTAFDQVYEQSEPITASDSYVTTENSLRMGDGVRLDDLPTETSVIELTYRAEPRGKVDSQTYLLAINDIPVKPKIPDILRIVNHYGARGYATWLEDVKRAHYRWVVRLERAPEGAKACEYLVVHHTVNEVRFVNRQMHTEDEDYPTLLERMRAEGWTEVYTYPMKVYQMSCKVLRHFL